MSPLLLLAVPLGLCGLYLGARWLGRVVRDWFKELERF